jgi:very-short-patch-repair endonuclease
MTEFLSIKGNPIRTNYILNLPYNPKLKDRANALRKAGNFAEVVFWKQVRNKEFWQLDFDRQRVIGNYIVDFYAKSLGLVIEIDGESHNEKEEYDAKRDEFMISISIRIFRISKLRVLHDLENVMIELEDYIIQEYKV